jgi:dUTP pyrophosphatase
MTGNMENVVSKRFGQDMFGTLEDWNPLGSMLNPIQLKLKKMAENAVMPKHAYAGDGAWDFVATSRHFSEDGRHVKYGVGWAVEMPEGYRLRVCGRGSIAKYDLVIANAVGLVDAGYRGEIFVNFKIIPPFVNDQTNNPTVLTSFEPKLYEVGEKICQAYLEKVECVSFREVDELSDSERGAGAMGSSGK